ncbi:hypothetical protein HZA38_01180 [Candidatus Peregrinibacteria bacterium]|nr:hypothetical protein [Candidatus Peregrinibacteria bacterium]
MSLKQIIETKMAPAAIGPYSQGIAAENTFYISGQLGIDMNTGALGTTFKEQATNALYNIKTLVESAGSRLDRVTKATVYLTDINTYPEFNTVYEGFFQAQPPAREVVGVAALPKGAMVEISCTGFIQDSM